MEDAYDGSDDEPTGFRHPLTGPLLIVSIAASFIMRVDQMVVPSASMRCAGSSCDCSRIGLIWLRAAAWRRAGARGPWHVVVPDR